MFKRTFNRIQGDFVHVKQTSIHKSNQVRNSYREIKIKKHFLLSNYNGGSEQEVITAKP